MPTFGELRRVVLTRAGTPNNHFRFVELSDQHHKFWNRINEVEFDRGYVHGVYECPDTPALCDMDLLTDVEFREWIKNFESLPQMERVSKTTHRRS